MNKGIISKDRFKRVNWASDDLLCQVKLFLSEDSPSQIGSKVEDHLQVKESLHSNGMNVDDLPPGFGGMGHSYTPDQICISQIKWYRPPKFMLSGEWHVVAGEESEERGTQNYREMRVLEALYPRASAIPPSPSVSPELEACYYDDTQTPIIPLNSTEDEDTPPFETTPFSNSVNGAESNLHAKSNSSVNEKLPGIVSGLDADVIAAACASLKSNENGSLIDTDLLIRILNEPKMIEALTKGSASSLAPIYGSKPEPKASDTLFTSQPFHGPTTSWPNSNPSTVASSEPSNQNLKPFSNYPIPYPDSSTAPTVDHRAILSNFGDRLRQGQENGHMIKDDRGSARKPVDNEIDISRKILSGSNSAIFGPNALSQDLFNRSDVGPTVSHISTGFTLPSIRTPTPAPPAKDLNYYKSLIRLHGSGGEEPSQVCLPELTPVSIQGHTRPKSQKQCKFFNTSKGCRYGSTCPFEHVPLLDLRAGNYPENDRSNKRLKISSDSQDRC